MAVRASLDAGGSRLGCTRRGAERVHGAVPRSAGVAGDSEALGAGPSTAGRAAATATGGAAPAVVPWPRRRQRRLGET